MGKSGVEILNQRLREVHKKFIELKECGMDEEILEIYLKDKTRLSRKKIKQFINSLEEFYNKLLKKEVLESLE